jgi:hypothetical protein
MLKKTKSVTFFEKNKNIFFAAPATRSLVCNPPPLAAAMPASSLTTNLAGNFSLQSTKRT